ncbi:DUF3558 domain-containing protein [Rhodococcus xishaensis]|uniref:DUF3558 domain-containing protein n=1 Tax=Rhodococcus xishaensis TaxID=2487364 RepID=A0A3S3AF02_9NOCA|nr:DUF3558 domain-containing protein [Rhodococcus xishaensis]RVW03101.1 DUF3558 domain-containing protein [Rhodococcus xishaensis]
MCSAVLLVGCGGAASGESAPAGPAGDPAFSPCDDIPDEAILAVGMDPATEERDIMGVHQPGWNICGWNNSTHFLSIFSSTKTMDEVRRNEDFEDFAPVDLAGREAVSFRDVADRERTRCDVAMTSGGFAVMVSISESGPEPASEEPCVAALRVARTLAEYIPV